MAYGFEVRMSNGMVGAATARTVRFIRSETVNGYSGSLHVPEFTISNGQWFVYRHPPGGSQSSNFWWDESTKTMHWDRWNYDFSTGAWGTEYTLHFMALS